jgi:signal transduction histidine kinase
MSLRLRILALAVGATATALLLFAVPLWLLLSRTAHEETREAAVDAATSVADYASTRSSDPDVLAAYVERFNGRDDAPMVGVVLPDGSYVGAKLPEEARELIESDHQDSAGAEEAQEGEEDDDDRLFTVSDPDVHETDDGQLVTLRVMSPDGPVLVFAYSSGADARATVTDRLLVLGLAAAVLLALTAVAAEFVSRRLVRQLEATAGVADKLSEGDIAVRAPETGPSEVRRVGLALNRLAGRIDTLLATERETVADLSHRLRSPLTAVRLDVEGLPPSERVSELDAHLDHLERTLSEVIRAARRPEREGARPRCDAAAVVRERVDFWRPLAEDQDRVLDLEVGDGSMAVRCAREDLAAGLDALLENCMAHTPERSAISVRLVAPGDVVHLEVRDRGPGLPPGAEHRGRSDRGSTGLGLDIARSCAEASGGQMQLGRDEGWTVVRLVLGRP